MNAKREEFITGYCARSGKTREQAEAFLAVLGSAMSKRFDWPEVPKLSADETAAAVDTFIGSPDEAAR